MSTPETERVRRIWEKLAPKYDKLIKFPERWLFAGGRDWVCSQATGNVLEIAVGTGRNFEHYPADVRLTGIDLSESMVGIARERRSRSAGRRIFGSGMHRRSIFRLIASILSSARFRSAPFRMTGRRSVK